MYYIEDICCLCLTNSNDISNDLCEKDENITYYEKLTSSYPQLVFEGGYNNYKLCLSCSKKIDISYEFSKECMRSIHYLTKYVTKLKSNDKKPSNLRIRLTNCVNNPEDSKVQIQNTHNYVTANSSFCVETIWVNENNYGEDNFNRKKNCEDIKLESNYEQGDCLSVYAEELNDYKLQTIYEDKDQNINEVHFKVDEIKTEVIDIKPEYINNDYGDVFDQVQQLETDGTSVHSQLAGNSSSQHSAHGSVEIQKQTDEKNTTRYELSHSCELQRSDVINIEATNDRISLNVTSPANHSRSRSDTCSSAVNVIKIHSSSEAEESEQSFLIEHSLLRSSYVCDVCEMTFQNSRNLLKHIFIHTEQKAHACEICKKEFNRLSHLVRHKRIHTGQKPYVCDVCENRFRDSCDLVTHKRIHTGQKPYVCDVCKKSFVRLCHLDRHKRTHSGQKPYACDVCQKRFSESSGLVIHKRIHTGEKPYVCDVCNKGCTDSSAFAKHKRTHTGLRPYVCDICKKGFSNSSALVRHKRIHSGEKPYVCDICEKKFSESSFLVSHKRTHHGHLPEKRFS